MEKRTLEDSIDNSVRPSSLARVAFAPSNILARAVRRIREYAPRAYIKLIALDWRWCDFVLFGATDARYLFLNADGIDFLKEQDDPCGLIAFLLLHETKHAELLHPLRMPPERFPDRERANIAADYVVNDQIHRINVAAGQVCAGRYPFPLIDGCLHDPQVSKDYSVEELYAVLWTPKPTGTCEGERPGDGDEPGNQSGSGNGDGGQRDRDKDTGAKGEGGKDNDSPGQSGNTGGAAGQTGQAPPSGTGDQAADSDPCKGNAAGNANNPGTGSGTGSANTPGLADFPGTGTADMRQPVIEANETLTEVRENLENESQRIEVQESLSIAGQGGGGHERSIHDRPPVRLDWREYLSHWLLARAASAWDKPINVPIYSATGLVSAGRDQAVLNELVVGADSSGSIGDNELGQILGSIRHAVEAVKFDTMHLLACDWSIRGHYEIAANDLSNMPNTIPGGGGTAFEPVFDWQAANCPDAPIIYLTDGHSYDLKRIKEPDAPVLWLSWGKPVEAYPFGDAVRIWL